MLPKEIADLIKRVVGEVKIDDIIGITINWDDLDGTDIHISFRKAK